MAVEPAEITAAQPAAAVIAVSDVREVDGLHVAWELVRQAHEAGVALTGQDVLLKAITKTVIETALDGEMSGHPGCDCHAVEGRGSSNSRNGTRSKSVPTDSCRASEISAMTQLGRTAFRYPVVRFSWEYVCCERALLSSSV